MRVRGVVVALSCAAVAAGCASETTGIAEVALRPDELVGVSWRLTGLARTGESFVPPPAGRFGFELSEDGEIHVVADCNRCFGRYSLGDRTLEVDGGLLACTLAACPSGPFDSQYVGLLAGVRTWEAGADELTLAGEEGQLRFESAP